MPPLPNDAAITATGSAGEAQDFHSRIELRQHIFSLAADLKKLRDEASIDTLQLEISHFLSGLNAGVKTIQPLKNSGDVPICVLLSWCIDAALEIIGFLEKKLQTIKDMTDIKKCREEYKSLKRCFVASEDGTDHRCS